MKKKLMWLIAFAFLFSCSDGLVEIPEGVIPKNKMVEILTDVQITEAAMMYQNSMGNITEKAPEYYQFIFNKHHITEKQFRNSFSFYAGHPELMDKIYEEVIIEISKKQAEMPVK